MNKETLEEAGVAYAKTVNENHTSHMLGFHNGAKWQRNQEPNKYSEEELKEAFKSGFSLGCGSDVCSVNEQNRICKEWFDQFKDK
jgi:nickel-dependent lactate racemase